MMGCQTLTKTTTIDVARGAEVFATLPREGVLRLDRKGLSMTGGAEMVAEDGGIAMHFADGASVYLQTA